MIESLQQIWILWPLKYGTYITQNCRMERKYGDENSSLHKSKGEEKKQIDN